MSWSVLLSGTSIYQRGDDFCASASIGTALSSLGIPWDEAATVPTLEKLRRSVNTWTGPFYGGVATGNPAGVAGTLNRYAPPDRADSGPREFRVAALDTPYDVCARIVNALTKYRSPTIALVYQGEHWVSIIGAFGQGSPTAGNTYTIDGFWICDPANVMKYEQVTYGAWLYEYFTGFKDLPLNQFIAVIDSRAVPTGMLRLPPPERLAIGLIEAGEATKSALTGLREHALLGTIANETPVSWGDVTYPKLKAQMGKGQGFSPYWLVAFDAPLCVTGAASWTVVRVDQDWGTYLGTTLGVQVGSQPAYSFDVLLRSLDLPGYRDRYSDEFLRRADNLRKKPAAAINQSLVWHPASSASPYSPLLEVDDDTNVIYVRQDGTGFTDLTD